MRDSLDSSLEMNRMLLVAVLICFLAGCAVLAAHRLRRARQRISEYDDSRTVFGEALLWWEDVVAVAERYLPRNWSKTVH
jgi:hypothetical protein